MSLYRHLNFILWCKMNDVQWIPSYDRRVFSYIIIIIEHIKWNINYIFYVWNVWCLASKPYKYKYYLIIFHSLFDLLQSFRFKPTNMEESHAVPCSVLHTSYHSNRPFHKICTFSDLPNDGQWRYKQRVKLFE